ncbi:MULTISPECIES: F510_1955 family glycosylhydrolase [Micrococcales]|uniref:DUF6242 domain-containing protein n=2 Tax=Micrococcales TaxID=85006 RepID=A0A6I3IB37_9MICO|nr:MULTISPECIES: hypothetical protein [Micrococcales]MTB73414.1 hypothetical protein [Arsenicicoccus cauae]REF29393.1 hypothetical protein DFJ65_0336 [Calidifontibacter indicus]RYG76024.1 hypothetical protein EU513_14405 [Yimella sp. RIT 621]
MITTTRRRVLVAGGVLVTTTILAACGATTTPTGNTTSIATPTVAGGGSTSTASAANQPPVAITHIHAVARDPKTGDLLLATHEGLFRHANGELLQNGPVIDLMGFTVAPDGTYYASGHPGAGVDLPQPVGLITSTDSGRTWRVSSRGGESDFHALTSSPTSVVGFDGTLRSTTDGETWTTRTIPAAPRTLAASPQTGALLATTETGLLHSTDDGRSWKGLTPPATALLAAWADEQTIVIATTNGQIATSNDTGATWTLQPKRIGAPQALFAQRGTDGQIETILVADGAVLRTADGGATVEKLL